MQGETTAYFSHTKVNFSVECFNANSEDTVIVHKLLECKSDWVHLLGKDMHTNLCIARAVGIPVLIFSGVAIGRDMPSTRGTKNKSRNKKYKHGVCY